MKRSAAALLASFLLAVALGGTASAAFDPYEWTPVPEDSRSYEGVGERFAALLAVHDYPSVLLALRAEAERSPAWQGDEPVYRKLLQAMDELTGRFAALPPAPLGLGDPGELDRLLSRVNTGLFQCLDERCFGGTDFEVAFEDLARLPEAQGEDFRYRVHTVDRLLWDLRRPALRQAAEAIRDARVRWDAFVEEGMSQYPWEAVFNTHLAPEGTIEFPPSRQWVLLHPQVGVEVSTGGLRNLRAKESLLVEVVGHVWYRWHETGHGGVGLRWWGISAAASLRDDLPPGVGVVGHWGRLFTVGVLWHDGDEDGAWFDQAPFVVLGLDLFRLVEDRGPAYHRKWEEAREVRERQQPR